MLLRKMERKKIVYSIFVSYLMTMLDYGSAEMIAKCPPSYVHRGGSYDCYLFHSYGTRTWSDARTYCEREDGNLVRIGTADMTGWLALQIVETGVVGDASNFWIDAVYNSTLEKWIWDSTGEDVNLDFIPADPNKNGDYGTLTTSSTLLGHPDTDQYHFICHRYIDEPMFCDFEEGWRMNDDRCYMSPESSSSWTDAEVKCQQISGYLLNVDGDQEQQFVYDEALHFYDNIWIGMTELDHPGKWSWVGENTSTYTNWNTNQSMPVSQDGFGAVVVDREDFQGRWMTEVVTNNHHYVCERDKGACVMGWELFGDSCYYFNALESDIVTWDSARELCAGVGSLLVIIESQEEDNFIHERFGEQDNMWIGLFTNGTEKKFEWVDGSGYSRDNFTMMTEQDENDALHSGERKCVFTHILESGTETERMNWLPTTCSEISKYICEVPKGRPVHMAVPPLDQYCPEGWQLSNDFCYYSAEEEASWTSAESYCKSHGGNLASINSWIEQDLIRTYITGTSWIGLNDRRQEGTYEWSDGNIVVITNWNDGEPSGGTENCVQMLLDNGRWNDFSCSELLPYVCKRPYSNTPLGPVTTTTEFPETANCGHNWTEDVSSGTCYRVVQELLSFADARVHCMEYDYSEGQSQPDLVSLSMEQEKMFVQALLANENLESATVFIGLINSNDGGLYWTDGSPVTFLNFADGEPSNPWSELCIEMYNDGIYQWNDADCESRRPFVCEKKGLNYVAPTVPPTNTEKCPDGWRKFNQHCYYVSSAGDVVPWSEAKDRCASMFESTLTSITSQDENDFLHGFLEDAYYNMWIGLYVDDANHTFSSWQDGSAMTYTNWYPGEPNNSGEGEDCGEMMLSFAGEGSGEWNDIPCDNSNRFACKMLFKTCPQSWQLWQGKCYYISDNSQTWNIGLDKCKEVEGEATLLSWHSQEEVDYVQGLIDDSIWLTWIGLHRPNLDEPWQWTDGSEVDYPNWRPGQPDNNDTELCALTSSTASSEDVGESDNYPCSDSYNFACEYFPTHSIGCDDGWLLYNGYCYYSSSQHDPYSYYTFDVAHQNCLDAGGNLASVHSTEENDFLVSMIAEYMYMLTFIGFSDRDEYGKFKWTDDSEVVYTNLNTQYGYAYTPSCYGVEEISGKNLWSSVSCTSSCYYFCKAEPTVTALGPSKSGCLLAEDLYFEGSCYRAVKSTGSFGQGRDGCTDVVAGSHLVTIKNKLENAYLSAYYSMLSTKVWIGLEEVFNADGSVEFKWIDGTDFTFDNWGSFEPMVGRGACVSASGEPTTAGLWYIADCNELYSYFCEYDREGYTSEAPPVTSLGPAYCAPGWSYNPGTLHCYKLMTHGGLTQGLAEQDCVQYGGHLVSIGSEGEESFILTMPDVVNFTYTTIWTGLVLVEGGGYEWLDGSPTSYLNWANGQPDSHNNREDCVTTYKVTLQLSDTYCDGIFGYMCKVAQGMSETTPSPITNPPDVPCPGSTEGDGWLLFKDHCYKFVSVSSETGRVWGDARRYCNEEGAELLSVLDKEENSFVLGKAYKFSDYTLWIGGYADYDMTFYWSDGEPWDFVNWAQGQPSNYLDQESCVSLYPNTQSYWNDDNCGKEMGWVCKRPSGNTLPPPATTPRPQGHCPGGWFLAGSKCIRVDTTERTFDSARQACKESGVNADLVSIHGSKMQAVITVMLNPLGKPAWIGLNYFSGRYFWVDESAVDYTHWGPGEPNNADSNELCGEALHHDGTWNDAQCHLNKTSICMQNIDSSLSTNQPPTMCAPPYENYVQYSGACYRAFIDPKSWQDAEDFCIREGAHLVSVESVVEESFVYAFAAGSVVENTWLGLNSLKAPEQYLWSDGFPVLYSNWGSDAPNVSDTNSRCVELSTGQDGAWFSRPCDEQKPFFCKYSEKAMPTAEPPVDGYCPSVQDWLDFGGGYCYLVETGDIQTWNMANQACIQNGGFLVSIHSQEELTLIVYATANYAYNLWTGLIQKNKDYGWSDGTAYNFFSWADSEPSNDEEQCVEMYNGDRMWNDAYCDSQRGYVCKVAKIEPSGPMTTPAPVITTTPAVGPNGKNGLSGGGIAGIVISCLMLVSAVGLVGYSYRNKMQMGRSSASQPTSRSSIDKDVLREKSADSESATASTAASALSYIDIHGANIGGDSESIT